MIRSLFTALILLATTSQASAVTIRYISLANSSTARTTGTAASYNSQAEADVNALSNCNYGLAQKDCQVVMTMAHENACMALARSSEGYYGYAGWQQPLSVTRESVRDSAQKYALQFCKGDVPSRDCRVETYVCSRSYDF